MVEEARAATRGVIAEKSPTFQLKPVCVASDFATHIWSYVPVRRIAHVVAVWEWRRPSLLDSIAPRRAGNLTTMPWAAAVIHQFVLALISGGRSVVGIGLALHTYLVLMPQASHEVTCSCASLFPQVKLVRRRGWGFCCEASWICRE